MSHHIPGEMAKLGTDQCFLLDIIKSDRRYGAIFLSSWFSRSWTFSILLAKIFHCEMPILPFFSLSQSAVEVENHSKLVIEKQCGLSNRTLRCETLWPQLHPRNRWTSCPEPLLYCRTLTLDFRFPSGRPGARLHVIYKFSSFLAVYELLGQLFIPIWTSTCSYNLLYNEVTSMGRWTPKTSGRRLPNTAVTDPSITVLCLSASFYL